MQIAKATKGNQEQWYLQRQFRITGSRCYGIYTYNLGDWSSKAMRYFWPKSFKSKYTEYGKQYEGSARKAYEGRNRYKVVDTGLIVSQKQPWLGYSPDGIVIENNKPIKLLEIKCPYSGMFQQNQFIQKANMLLFVSGKENPAITFVNSCKYLEFRDNFLTLKKNHLYYAQIQLGMTILNLPECDFVLYSPYDDSFLNIIIKYDEEYVTKMLHKLRYNYFQNMLHTICLNKHN